MRRRKQYVSKQQDCICILIFLAAGLFFGDVDRSEVNMELALAAILRVFIQTSAGPQTMARLRSGLEPSIEFSMHVCGQTFYILLFLTSLFFMSS